MASRPTFFYSFIAGMTHRLYTSESDVYVYRRQILPSIPALKELIHIYGNTKKHVKIAHKLFERAS